MKIAIVNNLKIAKQTLKQVICSVDHYELIWTAWDGQEALEKTIQDPPDLILMDLFMPNISGVEATRLIMEKSPCAIIIVSSKIEGNSDQIYEAMGYGALDIACTPTLNAENEIQGAAALIEKIDQIACIIGKTHHTHKKETPFPSIIATHKNPEIILIGSSIGGPQALIHIFSQLPENFPVPIVVAQHVDIQFATGLASWLNASTSLTVQVATNGIKPQKGNIYIAGTKDHLVCSPEGLLHYSAEPLDMVYRPSVDVLFKSFAKHYQSQGIAIILTGMGHDGAEGMLMLRNKGWLTIAQDKSSSILFGMPKAAIEQNAVSEILPLKDIPQVLLTNLSYNDKPNTETISST